MGFAKDVPQFPVFDRLNKTAQMTNELIDRTFQENYGIKGINYENLD